MSYADTKPAVITPLPIQNYPQMHSSTVAPTGAKEGDFWFDTTPGKHHLYIYDSGSFKPVEHRGVKITVSALAPVAPATGDLWLNTTTKQLSVYSLIRWETVVSGGDFVIAGNPANPHGVV